MTILARWLAGRTALAGHRQTSCTSNAPEEQCCRIITSIDDACMHPRTINSLVLLQACREVGGRSVGRAGGKGLGFQGERRR